MPNVNQPHPGQTGIFSSGPGGNNMMGGLGSPQMIGNFNQAITQRQNRLNSPNQATQFLQNLGLPKQDSVQQMMARGMLGKKDQPMILPLGLSGILSSVLPDNYFKEDWFYESFINSAWVVSQYENEYNPLHNHTGCDISGVIYLKMPDTKGRRNIESKKGKDDNDGDITFVHSAMGQRNHDILEKGIFTLTPQVGQLVVFPSFLLPTVYPFIVKEA